MCNGKRRAKSVRAACARTWHSWARATAHCAQRQRPPMLLLLPSQQPRALSAHFGQPASRPPLPFPLVLDWFSNLGPAAAAALLLVRRLVSRGHGKPNWTRLIGWQQQWLALLHDCRRRRGCWRGVAADEPARPSAPAAPPPDSNGSSRSFGRRLRTLMAFLPAPRALESAAPSPPLACWRPVWRGARPPLPTLAAAAHWQLGRSRHSPPLLLQLPTAIEHNGELRDRQTQPSN